MKINSVSVMKYWHLNSKLIERNLDMHIFIGCILHIPIHIHALILLV